MFRGVLLVNVSHGRRDVKVQRAQAKNNNDTRAIENIIVTIANRAQVEFKQLDRPQLTPKDPRQDKAHANHQNTLNWSTELRQIQSMSVIFFPGRSVEIAYRCKLRDKKQPTVPQVEHRSKYNRAQCGIDGVNRMIKQLSQWPTLPCSSRMTPVTTVKRLVHEQPKRIEEIAPSR